MKRLFCVIVYTALLTGCASSQKLVNRDTVADLSTERPNIIFLLADDLRADAMGVAGNNVVATPNLDSLAQSGVRFTNAFVTTSICAVSRASILTGQYASRHGVFDFGTSLDSAAMNETYPGQLKKNGYTTGFIGKYGVGYMPEDTARQYFDFWRGFNGQGSYWVSKGQGSYKHLTAQMGNDAVDFLSTVDKNKPFCLSVSFKAPHVEGDPGYFLPEPDYKYMFEWDTIGMPLAASEEYHDYFPKDFNTNSNGAENVARKRWRDRFNTPEKLQESVKQYYQLIYGMDVAIGRILNKLRELNLSENTVIVFTSDNGFYLGEYGFAGKWYGSDPSIRVPLVIYDPRTNDSKTVVLDQIALNIDVAPTLLSIAGINPPKEMQGRDLNQLITNRNTEWRTQFLYEHLWYSSDEYYIPSTLGIITEDYKYMKYFLNRDFDNVMFEEFYDRNKDEHEVSNRVNDPQYKSELDILKRKLATLRETVK